MAALALQPAVVDTIDIVLGSESGTMSIEELVVPEGAPGATAGELRRSGAILLAVRSPQGPLSVGPPDGQRLGAGDLIVAMGMRAELDALADALRPVASTS
jgi:voltage-gated potassium channel